MSGLILQKTSYILLRNNNSCKCTLNLLPVKKHPRNNVFWRINPCRNYNSNSVALSYSQFGDDASYSTPVVMLHGFLGSKTNWKYMAKKIASDVKCKVYTVDARNHGDSPHSTVSDYSTTMNDLKQFLDQQRLEKSTLIGHSMGGRTAMVLSTLHPNLVDKLIVVDISPFSTPEFIYPIGDNIFLVLRTLHSHLPPGVSLSKARQICLSLLQKDIPNIGLVDAILLNLIEDESTGEIKWRMNVNMDYRSILTPVILSGTFGGATHFICGKESPYVRPEEFPSITEHFPKAVLHYIDGAGHVVNFDKPVEFQKMLYECLGFS